MTDNINTTPLTIKTDENNKAVPLGIKSVAQGIEHFTNWNNLSNSIDEIGRFRREDSFKNKRAIGFACLKEDWPHFHSLREMDPKTEYVKHFLFDQLIIHHIDNINVANIFELSENKKLFAAEFGWWQVLSQNSGSNHRCFSGWANPDKSVLPHFLI